jgi:hypothetical protein
LAGFVTLADVDVTFRDGVEVFGAERWRAQESCSEKLARFAITEVEKSDGFKAVEDGVEASGPFGIFFQEFASEGRRATRSGPLSWRGGCFRRGRERSHWTSVVSSSTLAGSALRRRDISAGAILR